MLLGDVWIFFFSQVGDPQVKSNIKGLKVVWDGVGDWFGGLKAWECLVLFIVE